MSSASPTVFIIDFEAFQHGSEPFILKELCILDTRYPCRQMHLIFAPPCQWKELQRNKQRTYAYAIHRLHQLCWNEGSLDFCDKCLNRTLDRWLMPKGSEPIFYVLGHQKTEYLKQILPGRKIFDYQAIHNVTLKDLPAPPSNARCMYRDHGEHCAVLKCARIYMHALSLYYPST
jgi:hypothetical protein